MNKLRKEYTLFWFIENYSYCWHKEKDRLISSRFVPDGLEDTFWYLSLLPREKIDERGGKLSIYLWQGTDDAVTEPFPLNFEISVIAADESLLKLKEGKFEPGVGSSFANIVVLGELPLKINAEYLLEDTLRVRCQIWYEEGRNFYPTWEYLARTLIGIEKISFLHKVENFSTLKPKIKSTISIQSDSETASTISSNVHLKKMPSNLQLVIIKILHSEENYHLCRLKVSIVTTSSKVIQCDRRDNRLDEKRKYIRKLDLSFTREDIISRRTEFLPNDELTLLCKCHFSTGIKEETRYIPIYGSSMAYINPLFKTTPCRHSFNFPQMLSACSSALDDLKHSYKNKYFTDVVLRTKTNSFPAHKLVLCSRSSVFNAMLTTDKEEETTDCIQVDDLEDETVQKLLLFLYSDHLENLNWESVIKLYCAAHKYDIEKLKLMCSSFLVLNISECNAVALLLLANRHNDLDLKNLVQDFILEHDEEVYHSEEWEDLCETNPQLVIETMTLKYKR